MRSGDILGHEFMGEVVEVGKDNKKLKNSDRVVVPFTIICGECEQCRRGNFSVCERTNRNKNPGDLAFGHTTAGLFGYTHLPAAILEVRPSMCGFPTRTSRRVCGSALSHC
jgi:threonine dehydrogenase-like Zn-dependent dehydrogenase